VFALAMPFVACAAPTGDGDSASTSDELSADAGNACRVPFGIKKNFMCLANYEPVCGCDGRTYSNACEASRFVSSWTQDGCAN
jgi:hypothetical protein